MKDSAQDAWHTYRRLVREARPYWPHIAVLSFVNLLATPIALLTPVPIKIAVDSIVGSSPLPSAYRAFLPASILTSTVGVIAVTAGLIVLIGALDELQGFASWLLETYTGEQLVLDFRGRLFRHLQRLSLTYHDTKGTADSMYRLQSDAQAIQSIAVNGVMPFFTAVLTLGAMLYVIARIDLMLAVVALAATPLLFWITRISVGQLKGSWKQVKQLESSASSVLQEALSLIRVVKAFTREDYEQSRFTGKSQLRIRELIRVMLLHMKFDVTIAMIIAVTSAVTLSIGLMHVKNGTLTLGSLLLVIGYLAQLYPPLKTMSKKTSQLQSAIASAERAIAVLDEPQDVGERADARRLDRATGAVEFRHVTFAYGANPAVLHDVSFARAGRRVRGYRGPDRRWQDNAPFAPDALLRPNRGPDSARRGGPSGHSPRRPPHAVCDRPAGTRALLGLHCRKHPVRASGRLGCRRGIGRPCGPRARFHF